MNEPKTTAVAIPQMEIAKQLNSNVFSVISADGLAGFEKAYLIANAAGKLKQLLNAEYMKPIMELQGNKLGFKTDKDKEGGYPEAVVKNCLIEAVLTGVQPFGNQFNIIAGNCYITKEGFGYLLNNIKGLSYELIPNLPRINADKTSAAIVVKVQWKFNGAIQQREIDIPVKMNNFMGTDAVIGKATRKARAWLFNTINGTEVMDGDIQDADVVSSNTKSVNVSITEEAQAAVFGEKKELKPNTDFLSPTESIEAEAEKQKKRYTTDPKKTAPEAKKEEGKLDL